MQMAPEVYIHIIELGLGSGAEGYPVEGLSPAEKERAAGFRFDRDRDRYALMHVALRQLLAECLDVPPDEIEFGENEYGKPAVQGSVHFNISYSGDKGLIAIASVPVGVDIEEVNALKITPEMLPEVFSPGEVEAHFQGPFGALTEEFFRGWVRKESVVKAIGMGISMPLQSVDSHLDRPDFVTSHAGTGYMTRDIPDLNPRFSAALTLAR